MISLHRPASVFVFFQLLGGKTKGKKTREFFRMNSSRPIIKYTEEFVGEVKQIAHTDRQTDRQEHAHILTYTLAQGTRKKTKATCREV